MEKKYWSVSESMSIGPDKNIVVSIELKDVPTDSNWSWVETTIKSAAEELIGHIIRER